MGTKFERKSNLIANLGLQILATNEIPKEEEFYQKEEFRQIDKLKRLQTNIRILKKGSSDKKQSSQEEF